MAKVPPLARAVLVLTGFNMTNEIDLRLFANGHRSFLNFRLKFFLDIGCAPSQIFMNNPFLLHLAHDVKNLIPVHTDV
jgi:hypothetical protein